jgi:hypothetical protein
VEKKDGEAACSTCTPGFGGGAELSDGFAGTGMLDADAAHVNAQAVLGFQGW